jgi:hypothetical protein
MRQYQASIAVSIKERQHAVRLATADLDRLRDKLKSTEALLLKLKPCLELTNLLLRVRVRLAEVASLRRERVTRVATNFIADPIATVGKVRSHAGAILLAPLTTKVRYQPSMNGYLSMVGQIFGLGTPDTAPLSQGMQRTAICCRVFLWKMHVARYFASLHRRAYASHRANSIGACGNQPPKQFVTRSAAAQSRLVAPGGAPPAFC